MSHTVPQHSGAGVIAGLGKLYRVKIRRTLAQVKPEAEQLDGKMFIFRDGWKIDEGDSSLYVGEVALVPNDFEWPEDAPTWIASGDLEEVK